MGPENNGGPMVAYIDGVGTVIGKPLPEITPDYSEGGVSTAEAAESLAAMSGVSMTMEVAVEGIQDFFHAVELASGRTPGADIRAGTGLPLPPHKEKADPQEIRKADPGLVSGGVLVNV